VFVAEPIARAQGAPGAIMAASLVAVSLLVAAVAHLALRSRRLVRPA
jgi:hypothetical protein